MKIVDVMAVKYYVVTDTIFPLQRFDASEVRLEARLLTQSLRNGTAILRPVVGWRPYTHLLQTWEDPDTHPWYLVQIAGEPRLYKSWFKRWLSNRCREETVGYTMSATECPLANHLKWLGVDVPSVYSSRFFDGVRFRDLPQWAETFVSAVDKDGPGLDVTAEQALRLVQ